MYLIKIFLFPVMVCCADYVTIKESHQLQGPAHLLFVGVILQLHWHSESPKICGVGTHPGVRVRASGSRVLIMLGLGKLVKAPHKITVFKCLQQLLQLIYH